MSARRFVRAAALAAAGLGALGPVSASASESPPVPYSVQVVLLAKTALYDRTPLERADKRVRVLVVYQPAAPSADAASTELMRGFEAVTEIGGIPPSVERVAFSTPAELVRLRAARNAAIVYLAPGFSSEEVRKIAGAFAGIHVLTVGSLPDYVSEGVVLGFTVVSGKPKLLIHLRQARSQNVNFPAELLQLATLVD